MSSSGWIKRLVAPGATIIAGLETTEADVGGGPADFPTKKCQKKLEYDHFFSFQNMYFQWTVELKSNQELSFKQHLKQLSNHLAQK